MCITTNHFMSTLLTLELLIAVSLDFTVAHIGIAYGRIGKGLPPPSQVVALYKQYGIRRMRIYDPDPKTLHALRCSDIELTVGIPNEELKNISACQENANAWVQENINKYIPEVSFRHIVFGNEISPISNDSSQYAPFVLPAMQNVYNALSAACLAIKVTTSISTDVLDPDPSREFPPENGVFRPEVTPYLNPIIRFLVKTDAPLFAAIYPYFAYLRDPKKIDVRYALLDPTYPGIDANGVTYKNLFYAILDTVNAAVEKSVASMSSETSTDATGNSAPEVKGGESGHSTKRGPKKASVGNDVDDFASVKNARTYINNLIQAVKNGTPKRPGQYIETYIFAMFDEDQKPGNEEEKHFGLFKPDGQPKYPVNFN